MQLTPRTFLTVLKERHLRIYGIALSHSRYDTNLDLSLGRITITLCRLNKF